MSPFEVPEIGTNTIIIDGETIQTNKEGMELRDEIFNLARNKGWKKVKVYDASNTEVTPDDIANDDFSGALRVEPHNVAAS